MSLIVFRCPVLQSQAVDVEGNGVKVCHIIERESATEPLNVGHGT